MKESIPIEAGLRVEREAVVEHVRAHGWDVEVPLPSRPLNPAVCVPHVISIRGVCGMCGG